MADENYKRKLTAILSADVVGYSLLMADNELATIAILKSYKETMTSVIQEHNGRVVDAPGDNLLAEFASALDAVNSAVEIQKTISAKNSEQPDHPQMQFRIGINIGDVIHEDDCIYGDGVNVAARIESLADPGGVCISRSVFDHVKKMQDFGFEYLGDQAVKNITEPVRIYKVLTAKEHSGKVIGEKRFVGRMSRRVALAAILALGIIAGGLFSYYIYLYQSGRIEPASVEEMADSLPDKPSIAVLPFDNLSGEPEQEYLSDGIAEDIITAISKSPKMFVIDSNSSFTYKGKPVKVKEVGRDLGVRYVLEGSVRKFDNKVRITAQLIDAQTGHPLWAEKYDRQLDDILALQDEITKNIMTALQVKLTEGEQADVYAKGTDNLGVYLKVIEARELIRQQNPENNLGARQILEEAIELDPGYALAYAYLGQTHVMDVTLGSTKSRTDSLNRAAELAKKAISIDSSLGYAHALLGHIYVFKRQYEKAMLELEKSIELNPSDATSHGLLGRVLGYADRTEEAIITTKKAIRLNPYPPAWYFYNLATFYRNIKIYEEALIWAEKAVRQEPYNIVARWVLCSVYSLLDRMEEARVEANEVLQLKPKFSLKRLEKFVPYKNPEVKKRFIDSLRKAGLPD
ncbi:Adenylate cyclase (EC [Olavius algarvensis associated proteobacterium Delta 3]|nr:Adenylate cyclase (EC [Olavius algarvensis associated proteobacterium Delta 3]CAB5132489.1 Adenylate cyclase (EC [Olavius algarvensis associated proteobacterium Delta 3]